MVYFYLRGTNGQSKVKFGASALQSLSCTQQVPFQGSQISKKMNSLFMCCLSDEAKDALRKSKKIDSLLSKDKRLYKRTQKILLLGSGESGKSTFLKQMKIIHGEGFSREVTAEFQQTIYLNIVKGMKVLVDACVKLGIVFSAAESATHSQTVFEFSGKELDQITFMTYADAVQALWADGGIRTAFDRRNEFQLVGISYTYIYSNESHMCGPNVYFVSHLLLSNNPISTLG